MEDSVINNAMMLDTVVSRYLVTKDPALKPYADKLFAGLKLCATVSERSGFIVRSVSPFDGVSHYINSSRDNILIGYTAPIVFMIRDFQTVNRKKM